MPGLQTFDVFDTLLMRAVGDPTSVFLLLGRLDRVRSLTGCHPEEFARLRVVAERRARSGRAEVTLQEIYTEFAAGLNLTLQESDEVMQEELRLEQRLSRPVPRAKELLAEADGRKLALSDMYLPGEFIGELLAQHDLQQHLDGVVSSSDRRATKSTGALYSRIRELEGARPRHWRHVGDNAHSDVRVPRLIGIDARHLTEAKLNRYEQIWEDHRWETGGFTSLMAGASRLTRLNAGVDRSLQPIADVTAGVAGPILTAFVIWFLRAAAQQGIRRLYFLARDGEILWLLAQRLAPRLGIEMDLRYLYGSRYVYHRVRLASGPIAEADWAWNALYRVGPRDVLLRLGLTDGEADSAIERLGLASAIDEPVNDAVIDRIVSDHEVGRQAREASVSLADRVHRYLRQEGLCDPVPYAFVDTGWSGRILQSISDSLPEDATPFRGAFLFGYMKRENGLAAPGVVRGYLFDEHVPTGFHRHFYDAYGPLETFSVADHGMTIDFRDAGGRIEPVLAGEHNAALADWPWAEYRRLVMEFVDNLVLDQDICRTGADLRAAVARVLTEFWSNPTEEEARTWGRYVYEDDILARSRNRLARSIGMRDFLGKASTRYEGKRVWLSGSVMISSRAVRPVARAGLWFNDVRRQVRAEGLRAPLPARWSGRAAIATNALKARMGRG